MAGYRPRKEPAPLFTESVLVLHSRSGCSSPVGYIPRSTPEDLRLLQLLNLALAGYALFHVF